MAALIWRWAASPTLTPLRFTRVSATAPLSVRVMNPLSELLIRSTRSLLVHRQLPRRRPLDVELVGDVIGEVPLDPAVDGVGVEQVVAEVPVGLFDEGGGLRAPVDVLQQAVVLGEQENGLRPAVVAVSA